MTQTTTHNTTRTLLLAVLLIGATMMSGCIDDAPIEDVDVKPVITSTPDVTVSKYDTAKFAQSDIRESDGFALYWNTDKHSYIEDRWTVNTWSTYPAYDDMRDDENHIFSVTIEHHDTIRDAHEKMMPQTDIVFSSYDEKFFVPEALTYGDSSYKYVSAMYGNYEDPNDITGYAGNVFILNGQGIGRILIHGYQDRDECAEVLDYYTAHLDVMLQDISEI